MQRVPYKVQVSINMSYQLRKPNYKKTQITTSMKHMLAWRSCRSKETLSSDADRIITYLLKRFSYKKLKSIINYGLQLTQEDIKKLP